MLLDGSDQFFCYNQKPFSFATIKNPNSDRELVGATEFVATDPLLKKHQMLDPVTAMEREQELRSNHDFLNS